MKGLSIWQPHASLLMSGRFKPYETRSWKPWQHLVGERIWIHAGKSTADLDELTDYLHYAKAGGDSDPVWEEYRGALREMGFTHLNELPRGCLLGTARLVGYSPTEQLESPGVFGNFGPNRYAWHFAEHQLLDTPIPFAGKQGFFDVPEEFKVRFL